MNQCLKKRITPYIGYEGFQLGMSLEEFKACIIPNEKKHGLHCYYSLSQRFDVTVLGKDVTAARLCNNSKCSGTIPTFIENKLAYFTVFCDSTGEYLTFIDNVAAFNMETLEQLKELYEYIISADGLRVLFPELGLIWIDQSTRKGKEKRTLTFFAKEFLTDIRKSMGVVTIVPYKGITYGSELLEFGKTRDEIIEIDGEAQTIKIDVYIQGNIVEHRGGEIQLRYKTLDDIDYYEIKDDEEKEAVLLQKAVLANVTIFEKFGYKVVLEGIDIFSSEGLSKLKEKYEFIDSKSKRSTLFPQLGACVVGCGEKKNNRAGGEGKYVMLYSKAHELTIDSFMCIY